MQDSENNKTIGPYLIQKTIGKGGMGEVFLVYDKQCKRQIALKRIRPDLAKNPIIRERFLLEAKIAASLVHPSIIPIFSIHADKDSLYYTMPFIEGKTLKDILYEARQNYIQGHPISQEAGIPHLTRIFIQICEAIAYTHSNNILHRDLKPDNMIIGKYGEVMILDWGIANYLHAPSSLEDPEIEEETNTNFTRPGKIAGTITHIAPERALGSGASIQTDIYSLGVILYQILSLTLPFSRTNLDEFRKFVHHEKFTDPTELVPFRDIPQELIAIVKKCLDPNPALRYLKVEELLHDLINFSEGKPKWLFCKQLNMKNSEDWNFEANVLPARNLAISGLTDIPEWVHAMISAESFGENVCIQTSINLDKTSHGIGFLVAMPENERNVFEEGYCLWLSVNGKGTSRLYRKGVHVMNLPSIQLETDRDISITIEKVDMTLSLFVDNKLLLNYRSHTPIGGRCVGIVHKDTNFTLSPLKIYSTSYNAQISCLALPDAFFAKKDYVSALSEYRHIGHAFAGRAEGREALFRAGLTLLEQGKSQKNTKEKKTYFEQALKEFEHLKNSAGAPLEYLGKSLVYAALHDSEEEAKCLELACRKYPKHPLLSILYEHVLFRVHESSLNDRQAAYRLILFALRYVPYFLENSESAHLIESLQKHWEKLPYLFLSGKDPKTDLNIQLSYRLGRAPLIIEMIEKNHLQEDSLENAFFALMNLGHTRSCTTLLSSHNIGKDKLPYFLELVKAALLSHEQNPKEAFEYLEKIAPPVYSKKELRVIFHILQDALDKQMNDLLSPIIKKILSMNLDPEAKKLLDRMVIWANLLEKNFANCAASFAHYSPEVLQEEESGFNFLYGCYLYFHKKEEAAKKHFEGVIETGYPSLLKFSQKNLIKQWQKKAFYFERKELYRQMSLFYLCEGDKKLSEKMQKMIFQKSY